MHRVEAGGTTLAVREWSGGDTPMLAYSDWPSAQPQATVEQLIESARAGDEIAASWDELERELETEFPGREGLIDFFRAGSRTAADGRVLAGATAEVRGAALYGLVHARPSDAWPVLQAAGVPCLLLLASVPEYTDRTNRHFTPAFRQAWPDAEVVHLEGATHTPSRSSARSSAT